MGEYFRYFIVFDWEILVSTVCYLFDDPSVLISAQDLNCLLSVMYTADTSLRELFLQRCFFLTDIGMREFYLL